MKSLDLDKLKKSKVPKYRKIFEKAVGLIEKGWETEVIKEEDAKSLMDKHPSLKIKFIFGDLEIKSNGDEWFLKDEVAYFTLYHKSTNAKKNRYGRMQDTFHVQDVFYDVDFAIASIVSHDKYKITRKHTTISQIQNIANIANIANISKENSDKELVLSS